MKLKRSPQRRLLPRLVPSPERRAPASPDLWIEADDRTFLAPGPRAAWAVKRAFDAVAATGLIVALSPLLVLLMALISLDSPGSPFFVQDRVGRGGRIFRILKFRTMAKEAPKLRDAVAPGEGIERLLFKMEGDPRVTRLGRWLRKSSLDELPQLVNVVRGEMSLVGPRPLLREDFERTDPNYPGFDRWYRERHRVPPGITGLWQVSGRHNLSFDASMDVDVRYVRTWSLAQDAIILLRTPAAVLRGAH